MPRYILVEETSQIGESTCLVPFAFHYQNLARIIMSGSKVQLPPTVISTQENECSGPAAISLVERMIVTGIRDIRLREQYRMTPGIAKIISDQFYDSALITDASCKERSETKQFGDYICQKFRCKWDDSFFASIPGS